ncbi:MAG: BrxA/BrxB family bacilliredoxin [Flavobacteriales bacterium]
MYPPEMVAPMKSELIESGFEELHNAESVNHFLSRSGTALLVVNSVCGCAAGSARPGVLQSLNQPKKPAHLGTVFAGVDREATQTARENMSPFPPSSPCIALFKEGKLVHMVERHHIEGRTAAALAENLKQAYDEYC